MTICLKRWGNSLGFRIPTDIVKSLDLHENEKVSLDVSNDKMILTADKGLDTLLKDWPESMEYPSYWDAIKPIGKEAW